MLYDEFIQGTGCKDNEHNYKVYKELEIIYMNTDCSKQHIYDMGKKLVDNSKTPEQIELENNLKNEIAEYREEIKKYKETLEQEKAYINPNKAYMKYCREQIKYYRSKIAGCRWVLGGVRV